MPPFHSPRAVSGKQYREGGSSSSSARHLSLFQQTQLEAEETFYTVFPDARLAKVVEQQQFTHGAASFHYDIQAEPIQNHVDSSGTGYIDNTYISVGVDGLHLPRPPDRADSYIHDPSIFLHYDYGPPTTSAIQSFNPIPNPVSRSGFMTNIVHGGHHNSSVLEYIEPPHIEENYFLSLPVPALEQGFPRTPPPPVLEPVFEPYHDGTLPQQSAPFERAYPASPPDFIQSPGVSAQGYFCPPPPDTPSDLATSPRIEHADVHEGIFRAVVPTNQARHHAIDGDQSNEHHRRTPGRSTLSSSSHSRRNSDHHRHGHGHRLSRSQSNSSYSRQPERVQQRGMPWVGSQPTPPGPSMPLSPLPSKRQLEKKPPLACLFCRGRKIACGPPMPGSSNKTCNQCQRRALHCEYPSESRRGMRKKKSADPAGSDSASLIKNEHPNPDFCVPDAGTSDLPKPAI